MFLWPIYKKYLNHLLGLTLSTPSLNLLFISKIVDTPGFGDSDGSDNKLIEEMMDILNNELQNTNIIVLTIEADIPTFTSGLYDMFRQMTSIFGETW